MLKDFEESYHCISMTTNQGCKWNNKKQVLWQAHPGKKGAATTTLEYKLAVKTGTHIIKTISIQVVKMFAQAVSSKTKSSL